MPATLTPRLEATAIAIVGAVSKFDEAAHGRLLAALNGTGADQLSEPRAGRPPVVFEEDAPKVHDRPRRRFPLADRANDSGKAGDPRPIVVAEWEIDFDVCRRSANQAA